MNKSNLCPRVHPDGHLAFSDNEQLLPVTPAVRLYPRLECKPYVTQKLLLPEQKRAWPENIPDKQPISIPGNQDTPACGTYLGILYNQRLLIEGKYVPVVYHVFLYLTKYGDLACRLLKSAQLTGETLSKIAKEEHIAMRTVPKTEQPENNTCRRSELTDLMLSAETAEGRLIIPSIWKKSVRLMLSKMDVVNVSARLDRKFELWFLNILYRTYNTRLINDPAGNRLAGQALRLEHNICDTIRQCSARFLLTDAKSRKPCDMVIVSFRMEDTDHFPDRQNTIREQKSDYIKLAACYLRKVLEEKKKTGEYIPAQQFRPTFLRLISATNMLEITFRLRRNETEQKEENPMKIKKAKERRQKMIDLINTADALRDWFEHRDLADQLQKELELNMTIGKFLGDVIELADDEASRIDKIIDNTEVEL